jgi:biopolymer transport protein ExbB
MIEKLTQLMVHSGASWVLWLLFALSFVSVATAIERAWVLRGSRGNVRALVPELRRLLRANEYKKARRALEASSSVEGRVALAGLAEANLGADAAESAMAAAIGLERAALEKRLLFLGTVGNNAPFIGLLGTVIGVVGAFEALGRPQALTDSMAASALAPERVMGTIAEALVATAVGLVVAIPAVAVFNYFQGAVAATIADAETLGHVLLAHLKGTPGAARHGGANDGLDAGDAEPAGFALSAPAE